MLSRLCVFMPLGRNVKGFKYWWMRENWPPWHIFWTCRLFIFLRWKGFRRMEWALAYTFKHARVRTEKKSKSGWTVREGVRRGREGQMVVVGRKEKGKTPKYPDFKNCGYSERLKNEFGSLTFCKIQCFSSSVCYIKISIFLLCSSFCLWFLKMKSAILNNRAEGHVTSTEYSALQSYFTNSLCNFSYLLKKIAKYVSLNYCHQKPA